MVLTEKSKQRLSKVHPDLVLVVEEAARLATLRGIYFVVTEGLRTVERQRELIAAGASMTLRSRHLTGHAVDLAVVVGGEVRWDWPLYTSLALVVKEAARNVSVPLEWGGDWEKLKDGPHYQLPWLSYPQKEGT